MNAIKKYMYLWQNSDPETQLLIKPAFVFIVGYIGTGKSTLADYINKKIKYNNTVCTGVLRSILRTFDKSEDLFHHTYDFQYAEQTKSVNQSLEDRIFEICESQAEKLVSSIEDIYKFSLTERQMYIIEGAQIFPDMLSSDLRKNCMFIGAKAERNRYKSQLAGPNHKRKFSDSQVEVLWRVSQKVEKRIEKSGVSCFSTYELRTQGKTMLNQYLESLISDYSLQKAQLTNPQLFTVANKIASSL